MILLLAGCTSDPSRSGDEATGDVIPASDLEVFVTADPGSTLFGPSFVDFDRDGLTDLLESTDWLVVIVRGPLDDIHVPSDAWVVFDADTHPFTAELTGDDQPELLATVSDPSGVGRPRWWRAPEPYDGSVPPDNGWTEVWHDVDGGLEDVDADGTADIVRDALDENGVETLQLTLGPLEQFDGPPDVTITPLCEAGGVYRYASAATQARFLGDVDADGSADIAVKAYGWYDDVTCGDFALSLPASGVIDPFTSPLTLAGLGSLDVRTIGDWTGDDLPEVWGWRDRTVDVSPITLDAQGLHSVDTVEVSADVTTFAPQPFDLDGDGRPEVFMIVRGNLVTLAPPDLEQLTDPDVSLLWELGPTETATTVVDRDHAWLVVSDFRGSATLGRIDLGPASAL
jgi:hypothetical protein